jgi:hypothetical protein
MQQAEGTARRWIRDYANAGLLTCIHKDGNQKAYMLNDQGEVFTQDLGLVHPDSLGGAPLGWDDLR